ncbi:hypothetical protein [Flavobacterium sp. XS1P27]|uniref:hypothetical protein n=1 Tax=Flavobacterium sp. XS1P27 TaxID=3401724 RepID=UPI003AAC1BCA
MRKIILLFLIFTFSCSSKSDEIESIEIMSYYYNLNENHTEFKTEMVNYSVIDENGNVETIQKIPFPKNSFINFKSTIDKISLNSKNRNEEYCKKKRTNSVTKIDCGPINRIKIKFKNQKELTFKYSEYKTNSNCKEYSELQNVIQNNYSEKRFNLIKKPTELENKLRNFEKYSMNKDTLELSFPPMPRKDEIKFIK